MDQVLFGRKSNECEGIFSELVAVSLCSSEQTFVIML